MPEQTTETTQVPPVVTTPTPGQGTAGAPTTPAPSNTSTEPTTPAAPVTTTPAAPSKEEVQKRIDRMYARLQEERRQRIAAEAQARINAGRTTTETVTEEESTTREEVQQKPSLTESEVEAIVERKERQKSFVSSEMRVFERHPSALNEDGTFNMSDTFVQKYMEIGRRNPGLISLENGPELAEAMADKELGIDYKKGRVDEAVRTTQQTNSHTTTSTMAIPPTTTTTELTPVEKKVAKHMGLTDVEYAKQRQSNKVVQRSWEVKV
jgi:phage I-like protein